MSSKETSVVGKKNAERIKADFEKIKAELDAKYGDEFREKNIQCYIQYGSSYKTIVEAIHTLEALIGSINNAENSALI